MEHGSGSVVASAEARDSLGPSLTPKQQMQVKGTAKAEWNEMDSSKWNNSKWNGNLKN